MPSRHVADIRQVEAKTGRALEDWCSLLEANGIGERREAVNFLRDGYAVAHAYALAIADHCLRAGRDSYGEDWEDEASGERNGRVAVRIRRSPLLCLRYNEPDRDGTPDRAGRRPGQHDVGAGPDFVGWSDRVHGGLWQPSSTR